MKHEFEELSSRVIAAAIDVHKALGPGFVEPIYQKAMQVALGHRNIPFEKQREIDLYFEEEHLGIQRIDLIVDNQLILELKAVAGFHDIHFAQLKSYLKAAGLRVGILLNFNAPTPPSHQTCYPMTSTFFFFASFEFSNFRDFVISICLHFRNSPCRFALRRVDQDLCREITKV
jgi:GxxExxY protein